MTAKLSALLAALLPLTLAGACATNIGGVGPAGDGPSDPPSDPDSDPGTSARIEGSYEVRSQLSLDQSTQGLAGVLANLDELAVDPTGTLIDILEANGNDFLDSVPGFLKDAFISTANNYILSNPQTASQLRATSAMISEMVNSFEIVSDLQVGSADDAGNAIATHQLSAINFRFQGNSHVVQAQNSTMSENISVNAEYASGTVDIGSHELSLPLGGFALQALQFSLQQQGQASVSGLLSSLVDCRGAAAQVGDIKLDTLTLVSQAQIEQLCGQALNIAGSQIESKLGELDMDMAVAGGQGALQLSGADVTSMSGNWHFALGSQSLPSFFEATRR